jgi:L-galactose dehydrogenase
MDAALTPLAQARAVGLINASPLHMGVLSPSAAPGWHPAPEAVRAAAERARAVCAAYGCDLTEVALRYCLAHPYVSSTLVGMASVRELKENLRAVEGENDPAVLAAIAEAIGGDRNYVWKSGREENYG